MNLRPSWLWHQSQVLRVFRTPLCSPKLQGLKANLLALQPQDVVDQEGGGSDRVLQHPEGGESGAGASPVPAELGAQTFTSCRCWHRRPKVWGRRPESWTAPSSGPSLQPGDQGRVTRPPTPIGSRRNHVLTNPAPSSPSAFFSRPFNSSAAPATLWEGLVHIEGSQKQGKQERWCCARLVSR